jgi:hypothetical protein
MAPANETNTTARKGSLKHGGAMGDTPATLVVSLKGPDLPCMRRPRSPSALICLTVSLLSLLAGRGGGGGGGGA